VSREHLLARPAGTFGTEDGDLPACWADAIDDRIAELLDTLLAERAAAQPRRRLRPAVALLALACTVTISALVWPITLATWAIAGAAAAGVALTLT